jgi:hypothetical protein
MVQGDGRRNARAEKQQAHEEAGPGDAEQETSRQHEQLGNVPDSGPAMARTFGYDQPTFLTASELPKKSNTSSLAL